MKFITLIVTLFTITSCASVPPPKITDTSYENYDYEFAIDIPEGWKHAGLADSMRLFGHKESLFGPDRIAYFANPSSQNSLIQIAGNKSIFDPLLMVFLEQEKIEKFYRKQFQQIMTKLKEEMFKVECEQEIKAEGYNDDAPAHTYTITCDMQLRENDNLQFKLITRDYFYQCQEDDTCTIRFIFRSTFDDYEKGLRELSVMTKSLRHIPSPKELRSRVKNTKSFPQFHFYALQGQDQSILKDIRIEYDYSIENNYINFEGLISCVSQDTFADWQGSVTLELYFLGEDNEIFFHDQYPFIAMNSFCGQNEPEKFNATFPYYNYTSLRVDYTINK